MNLEFWGHSVWTEGVFDIIDCGFVVVLVLHKNFQSFRFPRGVGLELGKSLWGWRVFDWELVASRMLRFEGFGYGCEMRGVSRVRVCVGLEFRRV